MIHVTKLEKNYGPKFLFDGLDWHIKRGQRVGLLGPNGAGKTTLIKVILGHEPADGGEARLTRGTTIGYLPQEIAQLAGSTVREEARKGLERVLAVQARLEAIEAQLPGLEGAALEALVETYGEVQVEFERLGGFGAETRVEMVLGGLGFRTQDFDRDCGELSGGWQMRVALARLLLQSPDVLFLDEPTNHLDLESVKWLEGFLQQFPGSLVFISHDRWFLNRLADHIAELAGGQLTVYPGNFDKYLDQVAARQQLLESQHRNQQRRVAELERFISRFRAKASKAKQVQSRVKMLEKIDRVELATTEKLIQFKLPPPPKCGRVVIEVRNLHKRYGDNVVYAGLEVDLLRGKKLALIGPNGAGKSTLLKIFAGATPHQSGRVELGHGAKLYYFAQHQVEVLNPENTVLQEVEVEARGLSMTRIRAMLGAFLFSGDDVSKKVAILSGGEKNRLALVKMLLTPANTLLLDEPTNHLDMASRSVLEAALAEYAGTVVLISHDRHFIDGVCDEVWEVERGRVRPFLGGYGEYEARIAADDLPEPFPLYGERLGQRPKVAAVKEATSKADPRSKQGKREAAQARQRRSAATKDLKKEVDRLENLAQSLEEQLDALRALQGDPDHYRDADLVRETAQSVGTLEGALEIAYAEWETASSALEQAMASFE